MSRFLLFIGSFMVGSFTLVIPFAFLVNASASDTQVGAPADRPSSAPVGALIVTWLFVLVVGLVLSAPFFINPPDHIGIWSFKLPIVLWLFLALVRLTSWVGLMILWGVWKLIYLMWDPRVSQQSQGQPYQPGSGQPPYPSQPPPPPIPGQPLPGQVLPASWQRDPSGRHSMRYWDGSTWTPHVADGAAVALDPI